MKPCVCVACTLSILCAMGIVRSAAAVDVPRAPARITATSSADDLMIDWEGDEKIQVKVSKNRGLFNTPIRIRVNEQVISLGGFYVYINNQTNGFCVGSTEARINSERVEVTQVRRH